MQQLFIAFLSILAIHFSTIPKVGAATAMAKVTYNAELECEISENYCVLLRYYEADVLSDDFIASSKKKCEGQNRNITTSALMKAGDGWFDYSYELYALVSHSCTSDGSIRQFRYYFPEVSTDELVIVLNYTSVLTNQGTPINRWHSIVA